MAGRGTDIKLDREAEEAGGLHVILTEMHTAMRIDRQFIGRAGRQGDPGSSQLFVSLEDEIARLYVPKMAAGLRAGLRGGGEGKEQELSGAALRQGGWMFRIAQRRAEARGRRSRGEVLRQDDWIDKYLPGR
jgi:preprotein translocase subunit SecA